MEEAEFDAVIIGAGPGGGASAWGLTRCGFKVLVIEAGPAYSPSEYNLDQPDWEQSAFPERSKHKERYSFGTFQKLETGLEGIRSWNHIDGQINKTGYRTARAYEHMRGVGGSTLIFSGEAQRLHPGAMQMLTRFGVGADWPLSYAELEPYYCQAERLIGVAGPAGDPVRYRSEPYPLPPHPLSYGSTKIAEGCKKLGLSLSQNPVAILSQPYDNRPECNYCANCVRGCPRTDKGSVDVTFIQKAVASGLCSIRPDCRVTSLKAGASDKITQVLYIDDKGTARSAKGRIVVVSCGAVETPRLLLASKDRYAPDGIGNEAGHVGRHFMETLYWFSLGMHREPLDSFRGLPVDAICWDFNAPDAIPGIIGGCRFSPAVAETGLVGPVSYAKRAVRGWGKEHKKAMRKAFGRALALVSIGESLPNKKSYIDLDPLKKDDQGIALSRINTFLEEMDIRRIEFMALKTREILAASGVENIFEEYSAFDIFHSSHVFGTCRMGSDPGQSVVDRNCRSHRWKNLFIVDASVFPSSGGGESPSLTIEALALRTSDFINSLAVRGEL